MPEPQIEILGVYRLQVTEELFHKEFEAHWNRSMSSPERTAAQVSCRELLESVVLIEVVVRNPDECFDVGGITQVREDLPPKDWQVAWDEAYLSSDGNSFAGKFRWSKPADAETLRVAFYMHFWNPNKPLTTCYGQIQCPALQAMPERLQRLAPYEIVG